MLSRVLPLIVKAVAVVDNVAEEDEIFSCTAASPDNE